MVAMPRARRLPLSSEFKKAVRTDARGIVRLAGLAGFPAYTKLSTLLSVRRVRVTPLNDQRLRQLASTIGYTGEVYRG
jgi:hypothetical protein